MLCAVCTSMILNEPRSGLHHKTFEAIIEASKNGCKICHHLFTQNIRAPQSSQLRYKVKWNKGDWREHWSIFIGPKAHVPRVYDEIFVRVSSNSQPPAGYSDFVELVRKDVERDPSRVRSCLPSNREIPSSTGHEEVVKTAIKWLRTCEAHHSACNNSYQGRPQWYPLRLIHVGDSHNAPRLVSRKHDHISGPYVALSHCWGHNPQFLTLTSFNATRLRSEISLTELPKTFREIVITCRRMKIPLLWIDSICILQSGDGSREDWLLHVREMAEVYQNCTFSITVDAATNPHEGAFRDRHTNSLQDCKVWTKYWMPPKATDDARPAQGSDVDEMKESAATSHQSSSTPYSSLNASAHTSTPHDTPFTVATVFTMEDFSVARRELPLSKRAWVFQEEFLSVRTLHFQADRISWDCKERKNISEYLPDGFEGDTDGGFDCLFQYDIKNVTADSLASFYNCVFEYTSRELSHPSVDKLAAFASVAQEFAKTFNTEYCAGIFAGTMPAALLWVSMHWLRPLPSRRLDPRAPSWSWTSIDGRIYYYGPTIATSMSSDLMHRELARVENTSITLLDSSSTYGPVARALLTLTGPLLPWQALDSGAGRSRSSERVKVKRHGAFGLRSLSCPELRLYPDEGSTIVSEESDSYFTIDAPQETYLLGLLECKPDKSNDLLPGCWGLVLQRMGDCDYARIGAFVADQGFLDRQNPRVATISIT